MMKDDMPMYSIAIPSTTDNRKKSATDEYDEKMMSIRMRRGKWTEEEETYTMKLIEAFIAGVLPLVQGTTLRSFLSDKLCCDRMRITKKFAGANGIGKHIFAPSMETEKTLEVRASLQKDIDKLERRFFQRIDSTFSSSQLVTQRSAPPPPPTTTTTTTTAPDVFPLYRIAAPSSSKAEPVPSLLEIISLASVRSAAATAVSTKPSSDVSSVPASPVKGKIPSFDVVAHVARKSTSSHGAPSKAQKGDKEKGYVNSNYRVHGFEHLAVKEVVKPKKPVGSARAKSMLVKTMKDPTLKLLPKIPHLPKMKSKSIVQDASMDLQASNLLLDFFRSARDNEVSTSDTEESGEDVTQNRRSVQEALSAGTSNEDKIDSESQECKKMRLVL